MQEVTNAFDASRKINLEKMETILEKLAENLKDRESIMSDVESWWREYRIKLVEINRKIDSNLQGTGANIKNPL